MAKKWNSENSPVGAYLTDALNLFGADEIKHHGGPKFEGIRRKDGRTIRMVTDEGIGSTEYDTDAEIFDEAWADNGVPEPIFFTAAALGRKGGKAKSEAKVSASRTNGFKGGRPKKDPSA
jgi:hypothetical protein